MDDYCVAVVAAVPAGIFWMRCNAVLDGSCQSSELPQHEVTLSAYAIDADEVTGSEYGAFETCVNTGACGPPGPASSSARRPKAAIDRADAAAYCAWAGKPAGAQRLCTEAEWERAARGGCEFVDGDCAAGMPSFPWGRALPNAALLNGLGVNTTTVEVGGYSPLGDSPYGARHMAGNIGEWVSDWYGPYTADPVTDPTGPASGLAGVYRGGWWAGPTDTYRTAYRRTLGPTYGSSYTNVGFRCCRPLP